ncbi:MAG: DUF4881 domain-containing protein [Desulfovibrionales bacterium]|nr:DUF4881 domain-containing protein [Desulfovibrionales bacterium]
MKITTTLLGLIAAILMLGSLGCDEYGKVDQGRVVEFDKEKQTVTVIQDKAMDAQHPDYSILPAHTYTMPTERMERGADPKAGYRIKLDVDKKYVKLYNPDTQDFDELTIELIDVQKNIARDHPLVFDKEANKPKAFPVIDKDKKAITIYSERQKLLATFGVPDEYINLPDKTWDAGDEVRVYYKTEGVAIRFMNISKTDIFKK